MDISETENIVEGRHSCRDLTTWAAPAYR